MFTPKELKALNFLFRKFKDERPIDIDSIYEYLRNIVKNIPRGELLDLSLLFYFNWLPTGDFKNIKNPIRLNSNEVYYTQYDTVIALSLLLKDYDFTKYSTKPNDDSIITYNGNTYYVFNRVQKIRKFLVERTHICQDYDVVKDYVKVQDDQTIYELAGEAVDDASEEEIIREMKVGGRLVDLEEKISFEEDRLSKREQIENTIIQRLEVAERESDDNTIKNLKNKLKDLYKEFDDIYNRIYEMEIKMEDVIEEAKGKLLNKYEKMIASDPVNFYVNYKKDFTFKQLINLNYMRVNCVAAIDNLMLNENKLKKYLGVKNYTQINYNGNDYKIFY